MRRRSDTLTETTSALPPTRTGQARRAHPRLTWLAALLLTCSHLACCGGPAQYPEDALRDYVDDVRGRDADAVYAALGPQLRGDMSLEDFRRFFDDNYEEILVQAESLLQIVDDDRVETTAGLPLMNSGKEIRFVYVDGEWYLNEALPDHVGASPRATLGELAEAIAARDMQALLGLMTTRRRMVLASELELLEAGLRDLDDRSIVITGDRATVYLDWNIQLELRLEDGVWRLFSLLPTQR